MAHTSDIEWCDSTFNPWIGCTRVSPACDDCYAARSTPVRTRGIEWGPGKTRQRTSEANWRQPLKWNAEAFLTCDCGYRGTLQQMTTNAVHACGEKFRPTRRRVFCASLADWLDNEVPIEWLVDLLDLIRRTPNLDWLLLTKRVGNWKVRLQAAADYVEFETSDRAENLCQWIDDWVNCNLPPRHVWLGATVVNQNEADRDVPKLLQVPARVRFLSIEPMLGPIEFSNVTRRADAVQQLGKKALDGIHWIIAGGESGPKARPMHPDWVRSLRDQCAAAGVPFLFKQHGEFREWDTGDNKTHVVDADDLPASAQDALERAVKPCFIALDGCVFNSVDDIPYDLKARLMERVGKKAAGNLLDGRKHLEWPA